MQDLRTSLHRKTVKYEVDPRGVIIGRVFDGTRHTLQDARISLDDLKVLIDGRRVPLLMDMTKAEKIDNDARDFYAKEAPQYVSRLVLLVNSLVGRILGNFFIAAANIFAASEKMPTRLFDNEREAVNWLLQKD